jgi:hypothetical protein
LTCCSRSSRGASDGSGPWTGLLLLLLRLPLVLRAKPPPSLLAAAGFSQGGRLALLVLLL